MGRLQTVRFGDFLLMNDVISEDALLDSLAEHWLTGRRLGETITRLGYLAKADIERLASEFHGLEVVEVQRASID